MEALELYNKVPDPSSEDKAALLSNLAELNNQLSNTKPLPLIIISL